ncbi:MAG TPA: hypothetical protein VGC96_06685 [Candidatus Elarobacter sp.]|jgi:hypothetical protein
MQHDEFVALATRLERASDTLHAGGSFLQAIARRYYLVFTYARQAAEEHHVTFRRGAARDAERHFTHQALPNVVKALYSGQNSGSVVGGGPGISRAGRLEDEDAYRYVDQLQKDRRFADYGYGTVPEPYSRTTADRHLNWANRIIEDVEALL